MIRVGVIGYGYWGPNLVRNFVEAEPTGVAMVCDSRPERLALVQGRYPGLAVTSDPAELIANPEVDAVVVATPVSTHFGFGMAALKAGKHLLVEKPLASTTEEGRRLVDEADKRGLTLMVDHTFIYTGAVKRIAELVSSGEMGRMYYYDSVRINLGLFQHDVDVLWDLAVHDLAIMDHVMPERPVAVSATGMAHVPGRPANVAYLTLFFNSSIIAHIHANWLAPVKIRRTILGGDRKMIVYDDLEPSEKIKIYDKGIQVTNTDEDIHQLLVGYRSGDMWAPKLEGGEALRELVEHFAASIETKTAPRTDGRVGLAVLSCLEAATASLANKGRPVELTGGPDA